MLEFNLSAEGRLLGEGVTGVRVSQVDCVYKINPTDPPPGAPYLVANEWAAYRIAEHIGLPVPKAGVCKKSGVPHFVSLHFSSANAPLPPPCDARIVLADHYDMACGIIAFDILIANPDRHRKNIAMLASSHGQQRHRGLVIFDHGHALLGIGATTARLTDMFDRMGIAVSRITADPGQPVTNGNPHCIGVQLTDAAGLEPWFSRIKSIHDWFWVDLEAELRFHGMLSTEDSRTLVEWLRVRAATIDELFTRHQREFPRLSQQIIPSSPALRPQGLSVP